jgi:hypothetical protein
MSLAVGETHGLEFQHFLLSTTPSPGAPPLLFRGGELRGTPLLNQEGWRGSAGVVSGARATP